MSEQIDVDVEISGWTQEQTAYVLFNRIFGLYSDERPRSVDGALALYAKCLSTVKYSADPGLGKKIGKMAD